MKRIFLAALLAIGLGAAAQADTTPEATPVQTLNNGLLAAMKAGSGGASISARDAQLAPVVAQSYDLQVVTKNSVGFLWSTLPAAQQQELVKLIGEFTTTSYASQFSSFSGESFSILPDEKKLGANYIIQSKLKPGGGGEPVDLDYVVQNTPQGWRITDVLLGGTISQVALHNSDFASLVSSGDASRLIKALKAKIAALQGGAASQ